MSDRPARCRHGQRGAVLVETALVVGVILTMLLFSIQVGTLGFLQVTADAASYMDAHLVSVGVAPSMTPQRATSNIFPQIAPAQIVSTVAPAPSPSVPVDYGYNSTDASKQAGSASNRNGGVSMMEPTLITSTVTKPNIFRLLGKSVGITSQSVDALWLECGIHDNVSNTSTGCSPGGSTAFQGNYFTAGENTPPYFIGFDYLHHCTDDQPWKSCSGTGINFLALGKAEFLHGGGSQWSGDDWGNWIAGVGGTGNLQTFTTIRCHQNMFATIAAAIFPYPTLQGYYNATSLLDPPYPNAEIIYYQLHNSDGTGWPNETSSSRHYSNFATGPAGLFPYVLDWDYNTDQTVYNIYNWDATVQAGTQPGADVTVGTDPLYAARNCP